MGRLTTHETHRFGVYCNVFRVGPQRTFTTREEAEAARARMAEQSPRYTFEARPLPRPLRIRLGY